MRPLDTSTGTGSGVIGPVVEHAVAHASAEIGESTQPVAVQDVAPPLLPADMPPAELPAFVLSRADDDSDIPPLGAPHGVPGAASDTPQDISALMHSDTWAGGITIDPVQGVVTTAHSALDNALSHAAPAMPAALNDTIGTAPPTLAQATVAASGPVHPVETSTSGAALPGIDPLLEPFLNLLGSFGTGALGAFNPATLLSRSSTAIDSAMQIGASGLGTIDQVWQGQAARNAQTAGRRAQAHGADTSRRGIDISSLTEQAAAVVQRGNVQLTAVVQSFATQVATLAPVILTPPAQATLIAIATEHLGTAIGIVNVTRGELSRYTGQLGAVVGQLLDADGGLDPAEIIRTAAQHISQPVMEQVSQVLQSGIDAQNTGLGPNSTATHAAGVDNGIHTGSRGGGIPFGGSSEAHPAQPGGPGSISGGRTVPGIPGIPFGPGLPATPNAGPAPGFMGVPAAAGQRPNEEEHHSRTVQPYQSPTGNTDLTGPLGEITPEVIGRTHSDEIVTNYEMDQF